MKTNQNPQSKMASTDFQCPIIDACATGAHIEELCKAGGYTPTMLCAGRWGCRQRSPSTTGIAAAACPLSTISTRSRA